MITPHMPITTNGVKNGCSSDIPFSLINNIMENDIKFINEAFANACLYMATHVSKSRNSNNFNAVYLYKQWEFDDFKERCLKKRLKWEDFHVGKVYSIDGYSEIFGEGWLPDVDEDRINFFCWEIAPMKLWEPNRYQKKWFLCCK